MILESWGSEAGDCWFEANLGKRRERREEGGNKKVEVGRTKGWWKGWRDIRRKGKKGEEENNFL